MLKWLKAKKLPGFTLLELVVVIVVIGILAAVAIPTFSGVITRANDAKAQTTLNAIARDAQALYRFDNGSTPLDWYNAFNEAVSETPVASDYILAIESTLTLTLDLPHGTAQELIDAASLAASLEGANPALAGPSASPNQLSVFADPSGDVGMAIASSGNCVFGTIINSTISTWSAKKDLGADCAGSIAFVDPVTVAAIDVRDVSEYSNLTVPVAGTLGTPTASNNSISFAVNFTATASAPIDSYEVSRNGTVIDATVLAPLTSYTDNTAVDGTSYTYSVRAQNSIGYSTSVSTTAATSYALPAAPGFPILEAGDTQISIGWLAPSITAGAPISGYRLYRSADSGPYLFAATITPETALTYTDTTVSNGTPYSYQLESYGTGGTSARSPASSSVTPTTTPNTTPELTASASNLTNTLSWAEVTATLATPITAYLLQTSLDGTTSWNTIYTGNSLTYTHTPLTNGTDYFYRVAASNTQGTGAYSSTLTSTPIAVAASPINLTATSGNEEVSLAWTPVTSTPAAPVTGYFISKSTSHDGPFILDQTVVGATTSSATSTGLSNGTTYFYQIATYGQAGTGVYSAVFPEAGTTPSTVPTAPTIGTVLVTDDITISLPFTQSSNGGAAITSYTITSTPNVSLTYSGATSPIAVTANFIKGTSYTFSMIATNSNGASLPATSSNSVTPSAYAVVNGGALTSDATYYYRTFTSSGTLNVSGAALTADILVVAGGGGGGSQHAGGGGAGGVLAFTSQIISTNQTVTVGEGGAGQTTVNNAPGANGGDSRFGTLTLVKGGGGGGSRFDAGGNPGPGQVGGSGGGGGYIGAGGASVSGQGFAGQAGDGSGGGGGGAGQTSTIQEHGGNGLNTWASWMTATGIGVSGYIAGGGGGGNWGATGVAGGLGGGGMGGGSTTGQPTAGAANTGSGGGGGYYDGTSFTWYHGASGGSGVVIVRYLKTAVDQTAIVYPSPTGGTLASDSTYYYRTFTSSGTFSVTGANLNADVLVIAGGGGGGGTTADFWSAAGGGAGGVVYLPTQNLSIANHTVTVGAGGAAGGADSPGLNGGNSQFSSLTVAIGGGYGSAASASNGGSGGSGGGTVQLLTPGAGTSGQGFAGGQGHQGGGGGGGAGGTGGSGQTPQGLGRAGGIGTNAYSTWAAATSTGVNGYYAGGGGGGYTTYYLSANDVVPNGGNGGGGTGGGNRTGSSLGKILESQAGVANTGSGGGAAGGQGVGNATVARPGGSGIVIVRYLKSAVGG